MKLLTTVSLLIEIIKSKETQTESSANIEKGNQELKTLNQNLNKES